MSILTESFYEKLVNDVILTDMISLYEETPAVFTTDPAPGAAELPYIVTAGEITQNPKDSKNCLGRDIFRDIRLYTAKTGSSILIEAMAERARALFHRQPLSIDGYEWVLSNCFGPVVADEEDVYGRVLTVNVFVDKLFEGS